ncbi:serine hydrolase [uncultured Draconibacterium sp.]|uniref:serine hydrolase domain-containing protein n=1 Tax=uncultured Draconibacterium sp. TaxID=1573823 RepID=UPI002AA8374F|nr:serine hydrolase [uncultured Draconibacterium sp.]
MKTRIIFYLILILFFCHSCTVITRSAKYFKADIDDYKIFPFTEIDTGNDSFSFETSNKDILENFVIDKNDSSSLKLDEYLSKTSTTAFLVIRNDSILFEKYYKGYDRTQFSTLFSVSKSVTSLLVGLAIDDGYISNVQAPVTKYIPELSDHSPMFGQLTIEDLLNMRSGLKFKETYSTPFSKMTRLYYGTNQIGKIKRMKFECVPGTKHNYQSISTAILGIVVENATGKELGKYLEEKIWIPLGMENKATWSLDDKKHRSAKSFCGLNATAIDLAKIGRLYLNNGNWNGKQIISEEWVKKSIIPNKENDGYQYQWYNFSFMGNFKGQIYFPDSISAQAKMDTLNFDNYQILQDSIHNNEWWVDIYTDNFFALGIMSQVLYVNPEKNIIMVRLGEKADFHYPTFMYKMNLRL